MIARIYTEDLMKDELVATIVSTSFDGFTMYHARGYWKGKAESSLIVEVVTPLEDSYKVRAVARELRRALGQESVLVTYSHGVSEEFINAED